MHRYSVIACARWETPYIAEWIAYYEAIGFDHIYLHCNDDDPAEFAAEVARATSARPDFVSLVHFPGQGQQSAMYVDALRRARTESEWVTFLDIDEFLVLRGCDNIELFMERFGREVDSVHFNWVYFGNGGFIERPTGSVMRNYVWRASGINPHTKHITRAGFLTEEKVTAQAPYPFWHGLADPVWSGLKRVNVIGEDVAAQLAGFPRNAADYLAAPGVRDAILGRAVVNHYAFKSEADFMFRVRRGTGGQFASQASWQDKFQNGAYRAVLDSMSETEDSYLREFAVRVFPDLTAAPEAAPGTASAGETAPAGVVPPVRKVAARHRLWSAELLLGANGRVRHVQHGSLGSYRLADGLLRVKWDAWPNEDVFAEHEGVFASVASPLASLA